MFLSNASVRRPIAMGCLILAFVLLGLNAYRKMGLELMPKADVPYVTIVTVYPGASPEEIETDIAKRIEDAVVSIDGLKHVSSSCMENACQTLLEFQLEVDVDIAATDVREKLDLIRADFPVDVEDPKIVKYDINATPIVTLALAGDVPLDALYDYADNTLKDRITVIPGVAAAELIGGAEREVRVVLDPQKLAARGLTTMTIVRALQQGLRVIPSGHINEGDAEFSIKFDADYDTVDELSHLEVANLEGSRCRIGDVGRVVMSTEEVRQSARVNGQKCVVFKVIKKADANAVRVAEKVQQAIADIDKDLPGGMDLTWVRDDGTFIKATNSSAWVNVLQGILLTALILFIFLHNLRAVLVVGLTMPLTIVIGLFFMSAVGFTLNTSTLIAIGMSVGILVTNSIVVIEAIVKRLASTGDPKKASRLGASEAVISVVASAGTNLVVLFPLSVMGSMIGLFVKPLALTMLIMTAVSLFISFTLTPLLCSVLLKPRQENGSSFLARVSRRWDKGFDRVVAIYRAILVFHERHRWAAVLVLLLVVGWFALSLHHASQLGSSMVSEADRGEITVKMEFPTYYNLAQTTKRVQEAEARFADLPEIRHVLSTIGKVQGIMGQSSEGVYLAELLLKFSERTERTLTIDDLMSNVQSKMAGYPGAIVSINMPAIVGGTSSDVELEIAGADIQTLDRLALKTRELSQAIPGIRDVDTTVRDGKPEIRITPRRDVMADLGIPAVEMGQALRANLEGLKAGSFKQGDRNYDIVVELTEAEGRDRIKEFMFPGTPGHPVSLEGFAEVKEGLAPIQITRKDKRRVSKLFANLSPDLPLGIAVNQIDQTIKENGNFPPKYDHVFAGMYEIMSEGQSALGEAGLIAIVLVLLTLAAIMESIKQPLFILITVPLALIGVFEALLLAKTSLGIFEIMGIVMLIGIVVNNAILIMDQFNTHVREGVPRHKAMITAACERFRPIVMITFAAVLGMMPLAFGRGIGAESRNGVGIASIGGILVSGVLTLIILPIVYDLFTRREKKPE